MTEKPSTSEFLVLSRGKWDRDKPWDERRSIVPQVPVQLTASGYFAGKDPALDAVFRMIRESEAERPAEALSKR